MVLLISEWQAKVRTTLSKNMHVIEQINKKKLTTPTCLELWSLEKETHLESYVPDNLKQCFSNRVSENPWVLQRPSRFLRMYILKRCCTLWCVNLAKNDNDVVVSVGFRYCQSDLQLMFTKKDTQRTLMYFIWIANWYWL